MTTRKSIPNPGTQGEGITTEGRTHAGHVLAAKRHEDFVFCESGLVGVPSCRLGGRFYTVDMTQESCTCPDHVFGGFRCKHITAAHTLVAVREHVAQFPGGSAQVARIRAENVLRLVAQVSEPVELRSPADSYDLFCQVVGYRFSPAWLEDAMRERHQRVLERASV